jgi:hypothetical protein
VGDNPVALRSVVSPAIARAKWIKVRVKAKGRSLKINIAKYPRHALMLSQQKGNVKVAVVPRSKDGVLATRPDFALANATRIEIETPAHVVKSATGPRLSVVREGKINTFDASQLAKLPRVEWRRRASGDRKVAAWRLRDVIAVTGSFGRVASITIETANDKSTHVDLKSVREGSVLIRAAGKRLPPQARRCQDQEDNMAGEERDPSDRHRQEKQVAVLPVIGGARRPHSLQHHVCIRDLVVGLRLVQDLFLRFRLRLRFGPYRPG